MQRGSAAQTPTYTRPYHVCCRPTAPPDHQRVAGVGVGVDDDVLSALAHAYSKPSSSGASGRMWMAGCDDEESEVEGKGGEAAVMMMMAATELAWLRRRRRREESEGGLGGLESSRARHRDRAPRAPPAAPPRAARAAGRQSRRRTSFAARDTAGAAISIRKRVK